MSFTTSPYSSDACKADRSNDKAKKLAGQPTDDRGMPIAPKSMKELESWADTTLWDEAISKEWDGLVAAGYIASARIDSAAPRQDNSFQIGSI